MPNPFDQQVVEEFRTNAGRVGGPFEGARLLLLTTAGARTGAPHTVPLGYLPDEGDRLLVIASAGGSPRHPQWFRNVLADPRVTVEDGVFRYTARAVVLAGAERDALFHRAAEAEPGWAQYQERAGRLLPVVALERTGVPSPGVKSWGQGLRVVHDAFRRELALVRAEVARSGPGLGAQLRVNCLTVCRGLEFHHSVEDRGMFPALAQQHPELSDTIARLGAEHVRVAELLAQLQAALDGPGGREAVLASVDRLVEQLLTHLAYEEEQLVPVLDAVAAHS